MTDTRARRRSTIQTSLLAAGLAILICISAGTIYLVFQVREHTEAIAHTLKVENEISSTLLEIRRAESGVRAYLLTRQPVFLDDYREAASAVFPAYERLRALTGDNPRQIQNLGRAEPLIKQRLEEFNTAVERLHTGQPATDNASQTSARQTTDGIRAIMTVMQGEEQRLLENRTAAANLAQMLSAIVATTGSIFVVALACISLLMVRRSAAERDDAEQRLRDINVNLEAAVDERTADLREANEEIQRFAYIVSHDLRSPLVNIMGFTSELQELHDDIFRSRVPNGAIDVSAVETNTVGAINAKLTGDDKRLSDEFVESVGFIKSSIGKMDRLIHAILHLTREGRREFKPETVPMKDFLETIAETMAHQAAEADATVTILDVPDITSDRLALEQVFSNLIENAIKYLKTGVPGEIQVKGRRKLGFIIYDVIDNGRGIDEKDHQRIFDLFRRAGVQDRPGQGIGLAHVRALIRRMGGTLSVSSELGKGSTFTVTLPERWTLGTEGKKV